MKENNICLADFRNITIITHGIRRELSLFFFFHYQDQNKPKSQSNFDSGATRGHFESNFADSADDTMVIVAFAVLCREPAEVWPRSLLPEPRAMDGSPLSFAMCLLGRFCADNRRQQLE